MLGRNPAYFTPRPDTFWPERWLHSSSAKRTPKQFARAASTAHGHAASESGPSESKFESAEARPDEVHTNAAAFIPFSYGPANCAGRNLALVEMRMVVALLVQRFDMKFVDGYNPGGWEKAIKDWLVVKLGELPVILTPRG